MLQAPNRWESDPLVGHFSSGGPAADPEDGAAAERHGDQAVVPAGMGGDICGWFRFTFWEEISKAASAM